MIFCRACGKAIHETAPSCPHCGAVAHQPASPPGSKLGLSFSMASIALGALSVLGFLTADQLGKDFLMGLAVFALLGLGFGVVNLSRPQTRNGLSFAGVIVCSLSLLCILGSFY